LELKKNNSGNTDKLSVSQEWAGSLFLWRKIYLHKTCVRQFLTGFTQLKIVTSLGVDSCKQSRHCEFHKMLEIYEFPQ